MRFCILFLMIWGLTSPSYAETTPAAQPAPTLQGFPHGGDGMPWPWGLEIRFPWTQIQGVWAPVSPDFSSYFSFRIGAANVNGERIIQVTQYDPKTCAHVASGVGYETNRVIYASMANGNKSYDLTIRAFDWNSVSGNLASELTKPRDTVAPTKAPVIVLSVYPKQNWAGQLSYQMTQLQENPSLLCAP